MKKIAIVDSHHHLWDLDSKETHYPWLSGNEDKAFYGSFKSCLLYTSPSPRD